MTSPTPPPERPTRHPRRRRSHAHAVRVGALLLAGAILFGAGMAIGAAVESNPSTGGSHTYVRTYGPLPAAPVPSTVTLTVTSP